MPFWQLCFFQKNFQAYFYSQCLHARQSARNLSLSVLVWRKGYQYSYSCRAMSTKQMFHLHIISGLHQSRTCALLWVYALLLALFKVILEDHGLEVIEQSKVLVTANEKIITLVYAPLKREINLIKLIQTNNHNQLYNPTYIFELHMCRFKWFYKPLTNLPQKKVELLSYKLNFCSILTSNYSYSSDLSGIQCAENILKL